MFSFCIVLLIGTFIHTSFDHFIFYFLWIVLSGAAGFKLAFVISQETQHPKHKFTLAAVALGIHMLFLLYLHFAYHELAEEVSHALFDKLDSVPKAAIDKPDVMNKASAVKGIYIHFNKLYKLN